MPFHLKDVNRICHNNFFRRHRKRMNLIGEEMAAELCSLQHDSGTGWCEQCDVKNAEARMKNMINAIFFSQLCTDYNASTSIYGSLLRKLSIYMMCICACIAFILVGCLHSVCTSDDFRDLLVLHPTLNIAHRRGARLVFVGIWT